MQDDSPREGAALLPHDPGGEQGGFGVRAGGLLPGGRTAGQLSRLVTQSLSWNSGIVNYSILTIQNLGFYARNPNSPVFTPNFSIMSRFF